MLTQTYTLSNGVTIPKIALGTWQIPDGEASAAVSAAIAAGYRHIDTAAAYENETGVGKAVHACGLARESLFLTTKIPAECKSYAAAQQSIASSLAQLDTPYIDLLLIHAPKPWSEMFRGVTTTYFDENLAVWHAMEEAYHSGKVKSIGVSNFEIDDIQNLTTRAELSPMVNQIRVHIGHTPTEVITFCQESGILVEAYSPNATGRLAANPDIARFAAKYGVSVPQISIRYTLQLGLLPLPKTTNPAHMAENAALDFTISQTDMEAMSAMPEAF